MFGRLVKFAWRSTWRNGRRTVITGLAVGLGLGSMIFYEALMQGMGAYMIQTTTNPWMGDAQIHRNGFMDTRRIDLTVERPDSVLFMLRQDSTVSASTPRILSPASATSTTEMKPVTLIGVDSETDPALTMLEAAIDTGSYLSGDSTELIIGYKLADDLNAGPGDVIVITAARADSGLSSSMFFVSGICRFGSDDLDRYSAFVNLNTAGGMLGIPGDVHEIAVRFPESKTGADTTIAFWSEFSIFRNSALGWPELAPQVSAMLNMVDLGMAVTAIILFALVVFGIVNSLFMSVYERMYEFGVMKALGTRPGTIGTMVVLEAFWIAVISTVMGSAIGLLTVWITSKTGINFGEFDVSGVVFNKPLYPILKLSRVWIYPLFTLILTTAAGIYPGIHAGRLNPAEAMRKSL
ncbi:MAG: FtsX-like permease family protein [Candidatus Aegiribacteria sp.]|nr:FtsX-like permease family protein [Candidatus Aegiribacteria sp.]